MPGVFLQRFLSEVNKGDDAMRRQRDEVGRLVRESAEKEGRVWAMMWDVSGVEGGEVEKGESLRYRARRNQDGDRPMGERGLTSHFRVL